MEDRTRVPRTIERFRWSTATYTQPPWTGGTLITMQKKKVPQSKITSTEGNGPERCQVRGRRGHRRQPQPQQNQQHHHSLPRLQRIAFQRTGSCGTTEAITRAGTPVQLCPSSTISTKHTGTVNSRLQNMTNSSHISCTASCCPPPPMNRPLEKNAESGVGREGSRTM